jgi:hypothetical protein
MITPISTSKETKIHTWRKIQRQYKKKIYYSYFYQEILLKILLESKNKQTKIFKFAYKFFLKILVY